MQRSKKRAADQIAKNSQDFSKLSKYTKLEVDLMQHWKMIFVHTQDGLCREIAQTVSRSLSLINFLMQHWLCFTDGLKGVAYKK